MTLKDLFNGKDVKMKEEPPRVEGKIIHLDDGWGFVESFEPELKYTRIFFHWTALEQDTLNFKQLERGMRIEFEPKFYKENEEKNIKGGWRAIKIKVIQ